MHLRHSSLAIAMMLATASAGIAAAENPALTIYRADGDTLFENGGTSTEGYAIAHEQRALKLTGGQQALVVDGLPATLDPEAVSLDLGAGTRVLAQRVLSTGDGGALAAHRGQKVAIVLRSGSACGAAATPAAIVALYMRATGRAMFGEPATSFRLAAG